jgi:RES domain-containing protein
VKLIQAKVVGFAFRLTSPRYRDLRRTAEMSRAYPGRFNTPVVGAVYVSREPDTAVEELRRRAARDGVSLGAMHPRELFLLDLHLHEVVDLTSTGELDAWGLTSADLNNADLMRCQETAAVAARLGAEAIRWTSATGSGQSLAVFVEQLLPGSRVDVNRTFEITRPMLGALESGTPVTTLTPELSRVQLLP